MISGIRQGGSVSSGLIAGAFSNPMVRRKRPARRSLTERAHLGTSADRGMSVRVLGSPIAWSVRPLELESR